MSWLKIGPIFGGGGDTTIKNRKYTRTLWKSTKFTSAFSQNLLITGKIFSLKATPCKPCLLQL